MSSTTTTATTAAPSKTTRLSTGLPSFPSDIPTAPIAVISLKKLLANDDAEGDRVLEASRTFGFFYLDLRDVPMGQDLIRGSEEVLEVGRDIYDMDLDEKMEYALVKGQSLMGYKHAGTYINNDTRNTPDSTEFFSISKDHIHGFTPTRSYPPQVDAAKAQLRDFTKGAHKACMAVFSSLSQKLGLPSDALAARNIFERASEDNVRITKKAPHDETKRIGLIPHTDIGSITLLFNWLGGLQIESRAPGREGEWEYVRPIPGHAIINLGDAAVKFTNGMLKSAKHRVVNAPGEQGTVDRYSVAYFVRPNNEVLMEPVEGINDTGMERVDRLFEGESEDKVYNALEWQQHRQAGFGN